MATTYETLDELTNKIQSQFYNDIIPSPTTTSTLYLNSLNLNKLNESCSIISKQLIERELNGQNNQNIKLHQNIKSTLHKIISTINYELFQNQQLIEEEEAKQKKTPIDPAQQPDLVVIAEETDREGKEEDESELRKRLFNSSSNQDYILEDHHDSIQEDIMEDISTFVGFIKSHMTALQHSIEDEKDVLEQTEKNISKTQDLFNINSINLKLFNKQGKLGYWEMAKILAIFVIFIILTMFMISIF